MNWLKRFTNEHATEKVTFGERLAFGFGDFSSNIMYSAMAAFLMFYYTDYIGVSAAAVGMIMLASRIFDGASDLIYKLYIHLHHCSGLIFLPYLQRYFAGVVPISSLNALPRLSYGSDSRYLLHY